MNNVKFLLSRSVIVGLCLVLLTGGTAVFATTEGGKKLLGFRPEVKISLSADVVRDSKPQPLDKKAVVKPGEMIFWNLVSENSGNANAEGYTTTAKIPDGTSYVAGTATGEASPRVSYSIDGGATFSDKPMIDEKQSDGSVKRVAAPVSMYTNILFKWENPLEAGSKLAAKYQVQVK